MLFQAVVTIRIVVLSPEVIVQKDIVVNLLETAETDQISPTVSLEAKFPVAFVKDLSENRIQPRIRIGGDGRTLDKID